MTLALLFMLLAALWFALRFLKKRGSLRFLGANEHLRVESRLPLGAKNNLLIVRLPHKRLVLGVTEHHISKLAELPLYEELPEAEEDEHDQR
jgi:flagellar protein FliO/FliZ